MGKKIPTSSVSQVNSYRGCKRKWFLGSVDYLPQEPRLATAKGDILHAVLERYLDVRPSGLTKEGEIPELYPEGWGEQKDFFGNKTLFVLSSEDQKVIKDLVARGISEGKVIRRPDALVEYQEKILITDDISFQVRVDYAYDWTVEDHKSCKNFRYTSVEDKDHARYVGNDLQLRIYAYFWAMRRNRLTGEEIPEYLTIRHNQFCVDPTVANPVRVVQGEVLFKDCEQDYLELRRTVLEQLEWRNKSAKGEIKFYDMEKDLDTCGAYGGCPYKKVCVSQESPKMYKERVNRAVDKLSELATIKREKGTVNMAFNLNGKTGGTPEQDKVLSEIEKVADAPKQEVKNTREEPPLISVEADMLPSYKTEMKKLKVTCEQMGMALLDTPRGKALTIAIDTINKAEKARKIRESRQAKKAEEEAQKRKEELAKATPVSEPSTTESTNNTTATVSETTDTTSVGVTFCIGCYPFARNTDTISFFEVFSDVCVVMAKESKVLSFFELEVFKRREAFAKGINTVIAGLKGKTVLVPTSLSPDEQSLLNALLTDKTIQAYG